MGVAGIKAAVVAKLAGLTTPGQVAAHMGAVLAMEATGTPEFVTVVTRNGVEETDRTIGGKGTRTHHIQIELHYPWDVTDGAACEADFDARIEAISDAFRGDNTLGGTADRCENLQWLDDGDGFRELRSGVLVRYRKGVLRAMETVTY